MSTAIASTRSLISICDTVFTSTGTIGYVALLKPDLTQNLTFTANSSTETLTTASAHGLVTGSRIRVGVTGGSVPSPLLTTTDYYAIVDSSTTLRLASSLADATATTPVPINLTDTGSGTLVINEQVLAATDPLNVLLNKELTHTNWTVRQPLTDVGVASIVDGSGQKPPKSIAVQNSGTTALSYKHVLVLLGAGVTSTIGSTPTGTVRDFLTVESTTQTINVGETKSIVFNLKVLPS